MDFATFPPVSVAFPTGAARIDSRDSLEWVSLGVWQVLPAPFFGYTNQMTREVPESITAARHWLERRLASVSDSSQVEAWQLLEALLGHPKHALIGLSINLSKPQRHQLSDWLQRRLEREPLQYILGYAYFYGYRFHVTPAVLIPRPETEVLVHTALDYLKTLPQPPTVIDIGTGSGAIAIAIKRECPKATVLASDISAEALELAQHNAQRLDADITFIHGSLLTPPALQQASQHADMITANLPYLPASDRYWLSPEVLHEPEGALFAGADGLSLAEMLMQDAFTWLPAGAMLLLELDPRNVERACVLAAKAQTWSQTNVLTDLAGRERFLLLTR
jgi:release factor glutamine methyltransferase